MPYIKVQVLPTDATQVELTELELRFQMRPDVRQDYSFTNRLLFIKDLLDATWSPERIGLEMDRALDGAKEGDRKRAVQQVETDARLLQLIETIRAASGERLRYDYFDAEIQNIRDIDSTYETQRQRTLRARTDSGRKDRWHAREFGLPQGSGDRRNTAQRLRAARTGGRGVAQSGRAELNCQRLLGPLEGDGLDGLDILDDVTDSGGSTSQVSLLPIYRLLATTDEDDDVVLPAGSGSPVQKMSKRAFTAAVHKALTVAIDVKEQDSRGMDELRSPMRHLSIAAASCDRARDALNAVAQHQLFDVTKLQTASRTTYAHMTNC